MCRLIPWVKSLVCLDLGYTETARMRRVAQSLSSGPKPVESNSNATAAGRSSVHGTSKSDQELLNDFLGFLDKRIHDDTLNARRRESIQLARNFVEEHGYPVEDYCIYAWATHGIVKVLMDKETSFLPESARKDTCWAHLRSTCGALVDFAGCRAGRDEFELNLAYPSAEAS